MIGSRVPLTVLLGCLGAGKTTLLRRVLQDTRGRRFGVIVNDFDGLNIDAELVSSVHDGIVELSNGCVCCSLRENLSETIIGMLRGPAPLSHVLVETSGVAHPVGVAEALNRFPLGEFTAINALVAVIDPEQYAKAAFADSELMLAQMLVSDLVLLNKVDIAAPADVERVRRDLLQIAPKARLVETTRCDVPPEIIFGIEAGAKVPFDAATAAAADYWSLSFETSQPLSFDAFRAFCDTLPAQVVRGKGFIRFDVQPLRRAVFQLVGKRQEIDFNAGAQDSRASKLVLIGRGQPELRASLHGALLACVQSAGPVDGYARLTRPRPVAHLPVEPIFQRSARHGPSQSS